MINYSKDLEPNIRNTANLPAGTGAKYLVCLNGPDGTLIAKSWHHKRPAERQDHTVIKF